MPQAVPKSLPQRLERHVQALELRKQGKNYREIGVAMGISFSVARRKVLAAVSALRGKRDEEAWEVLTIELLRLDSQVEALWPHRADPATSNALVRIAEHRAKLLALFAPQRHELTGADGGPIATSDESGGIGAVKSALAAMLSNADAPAPRAADDGPEE